MSHYTVIKDRIDTIYRDMFEKILQYQAAILKHRYGQAQVIAEEILSLKTVLRANQDILYCVFDEKAETDYYTN